VKRFAFGETRSVTSAKGTAGAITVQAPTFVNGYAHGLALPDNGTFAVFTVSAVGVSGRFIIYESDFYVRDADGTHHTYVNSTSPAAVTAFGASFPSVVLAPQEPVKGIILFDIPGRSGTLVYAPGEDALGEWKF
jgi:hypothetical protein